MAASSNIQSWICDAAGTGFNTKLATAARQTIESKIDGLAVNGDERKQKRIEKLLRKMLKAPHVAVGILQDEAIADNFSMVALALVHEFGSKDGRIPQRSFIRSTCDARLNERIKLADILQHETTARIKMASIVAGPIILLG